MNPAPKWFVTIHPWSGRDTLAALRKLGRIRATRVPFTGDFGVAFYCFIRAQTERAAERVGHSLWAEKRVRW